MVGQLKFSPQEYFITRWEDHKWRFPFLFSAAIHLVILLIAVVPTSFFNFSRTMPEVYTVNLIDLDEIPAPVPEDIQPVPQQETEAPAEQTRSMEPVLSTRTIPEPPTEIKLLRPHALKKDVRRPPMDPSMMLAALNRIQLQEKAIEEKGKALEEKSKALEAIRKSILTRETATRPSSKTVDESGEQKIAANPGGQRSSGQMSAGYAGPPGSGQAATTALKIYKALVAQHIGKFWSLPEGQVWQKDLRASVLIKVRPDGIVTTTTLEKPSGNGQFDKFVMQTIEQASPLPPFPEEIPNLPLRLNFYPEGMI